MSGRDAEGVTLTMAQTGGAQREPSMEEILASIRRIIEDSDAARQPLDEMEVPQPFSAAPADAGSDDRHGGGGGQGAQHEVEAFQAELREPAAVRMPVATWREEAEEPQETASAGIGPAPDQAAHGRPDAGPPHESAGVVRFGPVSVPSQDEPQAPPSAGDATSGPVFSLPAMGEGEDASSPEGRQTLMSDRAGRQVAAAFGELSEAFAASRRRSFDEMAEEMLRPMLQDWLDNNLPTLVERLVREEIERVARGG